MKKTLYILSTLLLGLVSCNKTEFEPAAPEVYEETGLVAVTMQVQVPTVLNAYTKALGDRSDLPSIKDIKVAVFGTSGYPQTYTLAEPVNASGTPISGYAATNHKDDTNTDIYYFKVLLPVYEGEAHVHIIANGDETIKFVEETEESIMTAMNTTDNVGAFWTRVVLPDGIIPRKDENGIMQTDQGGNFIPNDETAAYFKNLQLVRNFAEIKLINQTDDLTDISWTLVNIPTKGSVAPMAAGTWVDDLWSYTYNPETGKMENGGKVYDGFLFGDSMDYTVPSAEAWPATADGTHPEFSFIDDEAEVKESVNFMYERTIPPTSGTDDEKKKTCILMRAKYKGESNYSYYRIDLTNEDLGGGFPIYRNIRYTVRIHRVGNHGASSPADAMIRDSGGNVSQSTEAQSLTDISDGYSRLYVEYVEKNFTEGGKKTLWVKYVPDVTTGAVDNSKVKVTVKDAGNALKTGTEIEKIGTIDGQDIYQFELNGQDEDEDLVSVLSVAADNGQTGDANSKLFREVTLRVMKKMSMGLELKPKTLANLGEATVLYITLPEGLPSSMFPLIFYIEDVNHTLNPTQKDDEDGSDITIPVQTGKSLADGTTNSFYFIRTVNWSDYDPEQGGTNVVKTQFQTIQGASATSVYVANEYFKTQHTNLLNDGVYVNPTSATVHFSVTSYEVDVEFGDSVTDKTWTVTGGTDVTFKDKDGNTITGGTGNSTFTMVFPVNGTTADVTRTATVSANGSNHPIEIVQKPLEFSITPNTQTVAFNAMTATVTVHAEEGVAWTASVNNGATLEGADEETGLVSGEGTQSITVNFTVNTDAQRNFTVTAKVASPEETVTATITQKRAPAGTMTFNVNNFTFNGNNRTGSATSTDDCVSISLANLSLYGEYYGYTIDYWDYNTNYSPTNLGYYSMGRRLNNTTNRGSITVTPVDGIKITGITVTYSDNTFRSYDTDFSTGNNRALEVSSGSYRSNGATVTWTGTSSDPIVFTNGYRINGGQYYFPRITSIVVTYAAE